MLMVESLGDDRSMLQNRKCSCSLAIRSAVKN